MPHDRSSDGTLQPLRGGWQHSCSNEAPRRTLKRLQYAPPTPQPRRMQGIHLDGYWEGAGRVLEGEPEQDAGEPPGWSGLGS